MSALDELIYDRTQADVTYAAELNRKLGRGEALTAEELADWNAGLKGAYNASDMNRVDAAVRELGGMLTVAGYPVRYTSPVPQPEPEPTKTEFEIGDIITHEIWRTYLDNVQAIRDAYYTMPDSPELPEPTAPLTYDGANAIERLIYDILALYEGMLKRYRICGTFAAGNNYNRQYIRSV